MENHINQVVDEEIKEFIENRIEWYNYVIEISEHHNIKIKECDDIFETVRSDNMAIMYEEIEEVIDGVKFCCLIYDKIKIVKTYGELKKEIRFVFVENKNSIHLASKYNLIQALTKIIIHLMWQLCYNLHPRLRSTPEEALNDIVNPIECSQKIMAEIVNKDN